MRGVRAEKLMPCGATRVRVTGRVQGVGFRWWVQDTARHLGLTGWVRNEPDGSVTACLAGAEVPAMLAALKHGPPASRVDAIDVQPSAEDTGSTFRVRR